MNHNPSRSENILFTISDEPESICQPVSNERVVPKMIFIVPYRNRKILLQKFLTGMVHILEDIPKDDYKIIVVHQCDSRLFNRGAIKNLGFLYIKRLYPNDYKRITLVFNDVDIYPFAKNDIQYITQPSIVKHFYGYTYTLGGIVSITGEDFEKINGYPNLWGWGYEDNLLQIRLETAKCVIDRSNFENIETMPKHSRFAHASDGLTRILNKNEYMRAINRTKEGITELRNVQYNILQNKIPSSIANTESDEILSNPFKNDTNNRVDFTMLNITSFETPFRINPNTNIKYNFLHGNQPFKTLVNGNRNPGMFMFM